MKMVNFSGNVKEKLLPSGEKKPFKLKVEGDGKNLTFNTFNKDFYEKVSQGDYVKIEFENKEVATAMGPVNVKNIQNIEKLQQNLSSGNWKYNSVPKMIEYVCISKVTLNLLAEKLNQLQTAAHATGGRVAFNQPFHLGDGMYDCLVGIEKAIE